MTCCAGLIGVVNDVRSSVDSNKHRPTVDRHMSDKLIPQSLVCALGAVFTFFTAADSVYGQSVRFAPAECPSPVWMEERLDYYDARDQPRVKQIESNHFDRDVEALVRGKSGSLGVDIDFLLRYVPNHPRALNSLIRLSFRDQKPQPSGASMPVECYLMRGVEFRPDDPVVSKLYGTYLARVGRQADALRRFEVAEKLAPDDSILLYNMGLVLVDLGDYERARSYAARAYGAGIELPGLREKLIKAGHWRE